MRLILKYTAGDGCTYSADITTPVVYDSGEALLVDFERECWTAYKAREHSFTFAGEGYAVSNFIFDQSSFDRREKPEYCGPDVFTVEEWFKEIDPDSIAEIVEFVTEVQGMIQGRGPILQAMKQTPWLQNKMTPLLGEGLDFIEIIAAYSTGLIRSQANRLLVRHGRVAVPLHK